MISWIRFYLKHTLFGYFWRRWKAFHYETHTFPSIVTHSLEGVVLSVEGLSQRLKRAIVDGRYEKAEIEIANKLVRQGDQILELGGAIGFVGLYCLESLGASRVVSVEANKGTVSRLKKNYELNGRTPEVIGAAIWSTDGTLELGVSDDFWEDSLNLRPEHCGRIVVRTLSLPSLLHETPIDFDCLIVDVEGAEKQILWEELPASFKTIIIELHPEEIGFPDAYGVLARIQKCGFVVAARSDNVYGLERESTLQGCPENFGAVSQ